MLSQEERKLLIKTYEETHDAKLTAKIFGINLSTVYARIKQYKEAGSTELHTNQRGRKRKITLEDEETILSSIRLNGKVAYTTYSGGTTGDIFIDYLENILIPTLEKGDIVIMDNMRSHHVKKVAQVMEKAEMKLLYLPPYSPDFNLLKKCGLILIPD